MLDLETNCFNKICPIMIFKKTQSAKYANISIYSKNEEIYFSLELPTSLSGLSVKQLNFFLK